MNICFTISFTKKKESNDIPKQNLWKGSESRKWNYGTGRCNGFHTLVYAPYKIVDRSYEFLGFLLRLTRSNAPKLLHKVRLSDDTSLDYRIGHQKTNYELTPWSNVARLPMFCTYFIDLYYIWRYVIPTFVLKVNYFCNKEVCRSPFATIFQ